MFDTHHFGTQLDMLFINTTFPKNLDFVICLLFSKKIHFYFLNENKIVKITHSVSKIGAK